MSKGTVDLSPQSVIGDKPTPSHSWLDESWRISMNKTAAPRHRHHEPINHHDLCMICMYADECMYRGTTVHPKVFCELFDVGMKVFTFHHAETPVIHDGGDQSLNLTGGLCCNCENRNGCTLRKKNGNVWHCEEYC